MLTKFKKEIDDSDIFESLNKINSVLEDNQKISAKDQKATLKALEKLNNQLILENKSVKTSDDKLLKLLTSIETKLSKSVTNETKTTGTKTAIDYCKEILKVLTKILEKDKTPQPKEIKNAPPTPKKTEVKDQPKNETNREFLSGLRQLFGSIKFTSTPTSNETKIQAEPKIIQIPIPTIQSIPGIERLSNQLNVLTSNIRRSSVEQQ